jgi:Zn-dependent peptidase ImmA (M78 family)
VASIKRNVDQVLRARGLSRAEISTRLGLTEPDFAAFLETPPKRMETLLRKLSQELLVPDFFFYADHVPIQTTQLPDFRLSKPSRRDYARETLRWMDFASAVHLQAHSIAKTSAAFSIKAIADPTLPVPTAARALRNALHISDDDQLGVPDARALYALVRQRIETLNVFVFQFSFPEKDGAGFCLAGENYDVIAVNTRKQSPARRLFTLAHEIYHCSLEQSGVSDPYVINNAVETRCNHFAVEFLAPATLVKRVAGSTIKSRRLVIDELKRFSTSIKLSLHASVIRLVETGHYPESAIAAWQHFIEANGDPEAARKRGGVRQEEWKYKLARYGFKFAELFGPAKRQGTLDAYELYQLSGIKPKYQDDYIRNAAGARPEDAQFDDEGEDE